MSIRKELFGMIDGREVFAFTMENAFGMSVTIINYGAIIQKIIIPDKNGVKSNVVMGFNEIGGYVNDGDSHGATVGRYANVIKGGKFSLDGQEYHIHKNLGGDCLHGGGCFPDDNKDAQSGLGKKLWDVDEITDISVKLRTTSPDGEYGFPGNLQVASTFTLTDDNTLRIEYFAETDRATVVNLTNHAYFNLDGVGVNGIDASDIFSHKLEINSDRIANLGSGSTPGYLQKIPDTPFDFTSRKSIGLDMKKDGKGEIKDEYYNNSYAVRGYEKGKLSYAATLSEPAGSRQMRVFTNLPAVQLYTAKHITSPPFTPFTAVCLESQYHPDTPNQPAFPPCVLNRGEEYYAVTEFRFGVV